MTNPLLIGICLLSLLTGTNSTNEKRKSLSPEPNTQVAGGELSQTVWPLYQRGSGRLEDIFDSGASHQAPELGQGQQRQNPLTEGQIFGAEFGDKAGQMTNRESGLLEDIFRLGANRQAPELDQSAYPGAIGRVRPYHHGHDAPGYRPIMPPASVPEGQLAQSHSMFRATENPSETSGGSFAYPGATDHNEHREQGKGLLIAPARLTDGHVQFIAQNHTGSLQIFIKKRKERLEESKRTAANTSPKGTVVPNASEHVAPETAPMIAPVSAADGQTY